jgi:fermentation-respiration switch protein FrsA (DUF1100 family)
MFLNILGIFAIIAVIGYIGLLLFSMTFTNRMLFPIPQSSYKDGKNSLKITTPSGLKLTANFMENPDAELTLLYCHGNREDVGSSYYNYKPLETKAGFQVMTFDYPGYGTSEGKPTEASCYEATETALNYLTLEKGIPSNKIVVYGRSLGGGPACELALRHKLAGMILEQTYTSVFRIKTGIGILPADLFENIKKIDRIGCPLFIIHGKADRLIPVSHSKALYKRAKAPKICLWVDYAGHADSVLKMAGEDYWKKIEEVKQTILRKDRSV